MSRYWPLCAVSNLTILFGTSLFSSFVSVEVLFDIASNVWFLYLNLVPRTHIDDEYANAAERDPKILLTTSRNPSAPLTQFVKVGAELARIFEFVYLIGFCCLFCFVQVPL